MAEHFVHQSLVGCSYVFETKWHDLVEVVGVVCDEGSFVYVDAAMGIWL